MQRKATKRRQLIIITGLSILVLVCLVFEAQKRGLFSDKINVIENEKDEQEKSDTPQKKVERITDETNVRVLIMTTDFASLFHKKVKITSSQPFSVTVDGKKKSYQAGKIVTYSASNKKLKGKKIVFEPAQDARLQITSITRQKIHPSYRNTIQLTWKKDGLLVTNELPLEKYLYAVVPSELSTGHKMEALKAQAVCARSYAYNQIKSNRYKKYNAHLDDSVSCQVYNNVPEDKRSRKAVNETKGMVLTSKGKVLLAYYYSTSWGYSASGQDVWNTKSKISYLQEKLQITDESRQKTGLKKMDLSNERQFQKFINEDLCETYDSSADWYRWNVTISQDNLSDRLDASLASCYESSPDLILTQGADGKYRKKKIKSIGKIKKIRVEKREASGLVTEVVLVGKKNVVKVCTQYNVRKVLAPISEYVYYNNGKSYSTMSLLPSAAFYISDASNDQGTAFRFTGGGFGHGTGMSQCGAAEMAARGKDFRAILEHYFAGAKIKSLSEMK